MDYDEENLFLFVLGLFSLALILMIITAMMTVAIDSLFFEPFRAEDAQNQCELRGYDIYTNYNGFLRTKAYGVTCTYVDYSRKQIDITTPQNDVSTFVIS